MVRRRTPGRPARCAHQSHNLLVRGSHSPVSAACSIDGPDRADLLLGGVELGLRGLVPDELSVAEVDELEHPGQLAAGAAEHHGVEPHLEQCSGLVAAGRRLAGLVVDDPDRTVGCHVEPVHDHAAQLRSIRGAPSLPTAHAPPVRAGSGPPSRSTSRAAHPPGRATVRARRCRRTSRCTRGDATAARTKRSGAGRERPRDRDRRRARRTAAPTRGARACRGPRSGSGLRGAGRSPGTGRAAGTAGSPPRAKGTGRVESRACLVRDRGALVGACGQVTADLRHSNAA